MSLVKVGFAELMPLEKARSIFNEDFVTYETINKNGAPFISGIKYDEINKDKVIKKNAEIDEQTMSIPVGEIVNTPDTLTIGQSNTWYLVGESDYVYISENSVEKSINKYFSHLNIIDSKSDPDFPPGIKKRVARVTSRYKLPLHLVSSFGLKQDSLAHAAYLIDDNKMTVVPEYFTRMGVVRVGGKLIDEFSKTVIHEFGHVIWHQVLTEEEKASYIGSAPRFYSKEDAPNMIEFIRGYTDTLNGKRVFGDFYTHENDKFLTPYSRMNVKEDFAESFLHYVLAPDYLLGFDKERYNFIHSIKQASDVDNVEKGSIVLPDTQEVVSVSDLISIDLQTSELRRRLALEFELALKKALDRAKIGLEHVKNIVPYGSYVKVDESLPQNLRAAVYADSLKGDLEVSEGNIGLVLYDTQEKLDALIYQSRSVSNDTKVTPELDKLDDEIEDLTNRLERVAKIKKVDGGVIINKRFYRKDEIERWVTTSTGRRIPIPKEGVRGAEVKKPKKSKKEKELEDISSGKREAPSKRRKEKKLPLGHIESKPSRTDYHISRPMQTLYSLQMHHTERAPSHYDLRLKIGNKAHSWAVPEWPEPGTKTLAVQQPAHSVKYMKFKGAIESGYGAGRVDLADLRGIDITDWTDKKKVFNIYSGSRKGRYALIDIGKNNYLLIRKKQIHTPLKVEYTPSRPRLKLKEEMWKDDNFVVQPKMDGARYLLYAGEKGNRLLSRAMSAKYEGHVDQTDVVPHIRDFDFKHKDLVLDGEIFRKDKYTTSAILNSDPMRARRLQKDYGRLKYYVFDILRYNNNDLRKLPYKVRLQFLERAVGKDNPDVKIVPSFRQNKKAYYKHLVKLGYEGVVLKDLRGGYNDRFMTKMKKVKEDDFVIMDYTKGKGKYKDLFGALIVGKYVNGKLVRVGKVGSGFTEKERIEITKKLPKLIKNKSVLAIKHLGLSHKGVPIGPVFDRVRSSKTYHDMLAESLGD